MEHKKYGLLAGAAVMSLLCLVACSTVDYGWDELNPTAGDLKPSEAIVTFGFDWSGVAEEDRPESMSVLMSRIINTVHYVWTVDSDGNVIPETSEDAVSEGEPAVPDESTQPDGDGVAEEGAAAGNGDASADDGEGAAEEEQVIDGQQVSNGEYYVMTFNNGGRNSLYTITDITEFKNDEATGMKEICAVLPILTDEEIAALTDKKVADFNPSYSFVPSAEPLWLDVQKPSIKPQAGNPRHDITFSPRLLTQHLTFRLRVHLEEGVTVNGITAAVSGVPSQVRLMSGIVCSSPTHKVLFDMTETTSENGVHIYEGETDVLGLFPSSNVSYASGPGILQISLHASADVDGTVKERVFYAGINMKNVIEEAGLMVAASDNSGYRITKNSEVLEVGVLLTVKRDLIISSSGEGLVEWYENEQDIPVEV